LVSAGHFGWPADPREKMWARGPGRGGRPSAQPQFRGHLSL